MEIKKITMAIKMYQDMKRAENTIDKIKKGIDLSSLEYQLMREEMLNLLDIRVRVLKEKIDKL